MAFEEKLLCLVVLGTLGAGCALDDKSAADSCQTMACPNGSGTYGYCVTPTFSGCRYQTSDGTAFACRSCGDCLEAASQALKWCGVPASPSKPSAPVDPPHQKLDGGAASGDGGTSGGGADGGTSGASTCDSCVNAAQSATCAQTTAACVNDPDCVQLSNCYNNCAPSDSTCAANCGGNAPQWAIDELNAVDQCVCGACSAECVGQC